MKILQLTAENIKKIKVVEITPKGDLVQITGANGSGKTSVLDSIFWALAGTKGIQAEPIRAGEEKALIKLDFGEIVVTRKFTEKGSSLTVENGEGLKISSPQSMLDKLIGELSFDPLEFARMDASKQYEEIKRIAQLGEDIDALERENKADFDKRTVANRNAKDYQSRAANFTFKHAKMEAPIDTVALVEQLSKSSEHNSSIDTRAANRQKLSIEITNAEKEIEVWEAKIKVLQENVAASKAKLANAPALPEKIDVENLKTQIAEANEKNTEHASRKQQEELLASAKTAETEAAGYTKAIDDRDKRKKTAIQNAKMPIPSLSLSAGKVLLNDIPFEQASSSEQIRTSVAIAMASNPQLRVIRIKDGSLLDDHALAMVAEMAKSSDYQVWVERVETSGKIGIVMEDGTVVADNQVA